jgi:hypothetical protein
MENKTNQKSPTNPMLISQNLLRRWIGILGITLPFILWISNSVINVTDILNNPAFINKCQTDYYLPDGNLKSSISHFYYTASGKFFTGILITVAIFMFTYKGHPLRPGERGLSDNAMSTLAGIFALGVVIFPTASDATITDNLYRYVSSNLVGTVHLSCAASFFIVLAFMSIVNFRRGEKIEDYGKLNYHKLYLRCGQVMLGSLGILLLYFFISDSHLGKKLHDYKFVYVMECVCLIAFGISWLTKGRVDYGAALRMFGIGKNNM